MELVGGGLSMGPTPSSFLYITAKLSALGLILTSFSSSNISSGAFKQGEFVCECECVCVGGSGWVGGSGFKN